MGGVKLNPDRKDPVFKSMPNQLYLCSLSLPSTPVQERAKNFTLLTQEG